MIISTARLNEKLNEAPPWEDLFRGETSIQMRHVRKRYKATKGTCARAILVVTFVARAIMVFLLLNNKIETMA